MKHSLLFSLFLITISCQPATEIPIQEEQLLKTWIFQGIDYEEFTSFSPTIEASLIQNKYFLHLFPDGSASVISGDEYLVGNYTYQEEAHTLEINFNKSNSTDHVVNDITGIAILRADMIFNNLRLKTADELEILMGDIERVGQVTFEGYAKIDTNLDIHPYYPSNNFWRFKPATAETENELKQRLLNHITHQKLLYQHTLEDPNYYLSTTHSKGPLQHYKGSVGIKDFTKIPAQWHQTYWSSEEAAEAFGMLRTYLGNKVIRGKSGSDWKQTNYEILVKLEERMKEVVE